MKQVRKAEHETHFVRIKKIDEEKRVVYGEVYAPNVLDTYTDFMSAEDIELMAHRFMQLQSLKSTIDTNHDEVSNGSYPVESFIAREGDPDYTPGAWVLATKVEDDEIWSMIKSGELNGYSFQALVRKLAVVVDIEVTPNKAGITEPGDADNHEHVFYVELNDEGRVVKGRTSTVNGHYHDIKRGTATEKAAGHSHRINIGD